MSILPIKHPHSAIKLSVTNKLNKFILLTPQLNINMVFLLISFQIHYKKTNCKIRNLHIFAHKVFSIDNIIIALIILIVNNIFGKFI